MPTHFLVELSAKVPGGQGFTHKLFSSSANVFSVIGQIFTHFLVEMSAYEVYGHLGTHKLVVSSANTVGVALGH